MHYPCMHANMNFWNAFDLNTKMIVKVCFLASFYTSSRLNFLFLSQWVSLTSSSAGCAAPAHYLPNYLAHFQISQNLLVNFCGVGTYVYLPLKIWLLPSFIYFLTLMVSVKTLVQVPEKLLLETKTLWPRDSKYREGIYSSITGRELLLSFIHIYSCPDSLQNNLYF